ncbi:hypothetical protein [Haloarcula salinisoli]|uniref:Uncharacterized protein n=1 Tax=Haloarcula salinisoli TaxID=2487746 RepID=A0A8J8CEH0_9EURY|nr:hypothetical protein [Halomicroarcula salinisoli]MBX0288453.1 hypothetical protein [Halomicroarcula salinisoli]MBX0305725.1 hypothetical protein [Halomicroarcula salinisoli]
MSRDNNLIQRREFTLGLSGLIAAGSLTGTVSGSSGNVSSSKNNVEVVFDSITGENQSSEDLDTTMSQGETIEAFFQIDDTDVINIHYGESDDKSYIATADLKNRELLIEKESSDDSEVLSSTQIVGVPEGSCRIAIEWKNSGEHNVVLYNGFLRTHCGTKDREFESGTVSTTIEGTEESSLKLAAKNVTLPPGISAKGSNQTLNDKLKQKVEKNGRIESITPSEDNLEFKMANGETVTVEHREAGNNVQLTDWDGKKYIVQQNRSDLFVEIEKRINNEMHVGGN